MTGIPTLSARLPEERGDLLAAPASLVGDGMLVPCADGTSRPYVALDGAASSSALPAVLDEVVRFLPSYSSVHRGAGYKSRVATAAYEAARASALSFAGAHPDRDVAIFCRNTTDAVNLLAFRLRLTKNDVVVTTVLEHHANLLPWQRTATLRVVECEPDGTLDPEAVDRALRGPTRPRLLAITGASNVTGWMPPLGLIIDMAHELGIPVAVDAAQLAPHRPLPTDADFVAWSGHKMYAPFGAGVLIGPRTAFEEGVPFLAGGGAVDLVDLDEVVWTEPPDREEAGSPNVVGAVALHRAMDWLCDFGWDRIAVHERALAMRLRSGLGDIDGVRLLGPSPEIDTLAVASFTVHDLHHGLVAARLSWEFGIGVRHGCFCAHPYLTRLLGMSDVEVASYRSAVLRGDRSNVPGAVRASASLSTTGGDVDALMTAVREIAGDPDGGPAYAQDARTGDWFPEGGGPDRGGMAGACAGR